MIEDLKTFDFDRSVNGPSDVPKSQHSMSSLHSDTIGIVGMNKQKTIFEDDYTVLDSQKVPPNTLESI